MTADGRPEEQLDVRRRVALVGPHPDSRGGVAATVRALACSHLRARFELVIVPTQVDAPLRVKLREGASPEALARRAGSIYEEVLAGR